jgi:hypothetical protein
LKPPLQVASSHYCGTSPICVYAGKSTLTDSLVAAAGIMSVEQVRSGTMRVHWEHGADSVLAMARGGNCFGAGTRSFA